MAPRRCTGTTKKGKPCRARPLRDGDTCLAHADQETRESTGFGGAQEGAGRPRLPKPHELLRERIEADLERIARVYHDAEDATRGVVVGSGEFAELVEVPDHKVRLKAADALLDRVYGKPKQTLEQTGQDGGPIGHEIVIDDETRKLIRELAERRARARSA